MIVKFLVTIDTEKSAQEADHDLRHLLGGVSLSSEALLAASRVRETLESVLQVQRPRGQTPVGWIYDPVTRLGFRVMDVVMSGRPELAEES